jgi:hypothetical protein
MVSFGWKYLLNPEEVVSVDMLYGGRPSGFGPVRILVGPKPRQRGRLSTRGALRSPYYGHAVDFETSIGYL